MLTDRDMAVLRVLAKDGPEAAIHFTKEPDPIKLNPVVAAHVNAHRVWRESCENFVNSSKRCWKVWMTLWTTPFLGQNLNWSPSLCE